MIGERGGVFCGMREDREYKVRMFAPAKPKKVSIGGKRVKFERDGNFIVFDMGEEHEALVKF